ncbi:MAG: heavy-metal-associated domain-containing protein [Flavobacterium sp.]|jgi:mercuric ion binding protein
MKNVILTMFLVLFTTTNAQEKKEQKSKSVSYEIPVNGNCNRCKKRIENACYSVKGVKKAVWHQDHQDIHLVIDETKTNLDEVRKAIAKAGHDTDKIKSDEETYKNLHHCCKYERM